MIELTGLFCHPVKSCRAVALRRGRVDRLGLVPDRRWMIVDERGRFLTQRELPRLALVEATLADERLSLAAPGAAPLALPVAGAAARRIEIEVWRHRGPALDQGDLAAAWLTSLLGVACRLVRVPDDHARLVNPRFAPQEAHTAFTDGYPFLLIGEESLAELNRRLAQPVPMARFRPNLVVRGAAPFAEDAWKRIRIGALEFDVAKPCERCSVTTVDPARGERLGPEPLRTLAKFRRGGESVLFGQNLVHRGEGEIAVGDAVELLA